MTLNLKPLLQLFKTFADFVNSYRKDTYSWKGTVKQESTGVDSVLEVGCNIRPLLVNHSYSIHDGLDPDPTINQDDTRPIFTNFFNIKLEEFIPIYQYDLIILDMVFEHLEDNSVTIDILKKSLKENGKILIHAPSNLHPFSVLNQLIPYKLKTTLLKIFRPWSHPGDITGWKSYYNKCNIISIEKLMKTKNMKIEKACFRYNGSDYFAFFPPFFLLVVLYEEIISFLKISFLSSHFMLILKHEK